MKALWILMLAMAIGGVNADAAEETRIRCDFMILAQDLEGGSAETSFTKVILVKETHGGEPLVVEAKPYEVAVILDSNWRGLSWSKNGEVIAEAIFATSKSIEMPTTLILYNPKNSEEQVNISCDQPVTKIDVDLSKE